MKRKYILKIIMLSLLIIIFLNFAIITKYVYEFKYIIVEEDYKKSFSTNINNKIIVVVINKDYVSIKDCYKLDRKERIKLISIIKKEIETDRTINNLEGEFALHSVLYKFGIVKDSAKNAELEFKGDSRWYIKIGTILFQILGV